MTQSPSNPTDFFPDETGQLVRQPCVFVVDDDPDVRRAIALLAKSVDLDCRPCSSAEEFFSAYDPEQPGCLVIDLRMPVMSGLELQKQVAARNIVLPIIFITAHGEVETSTEAMRAGAVDFLSKPYRPQLLLDRIHEAIKIDKQKRESREHRNQIEKLRSRLSEREKEVLVLLTEGDSTKIIARKLGISQKTVDNHRSKILDKMEVDNTTQLTSMIYKHCCNEQFQNANRGLIS